MTASLKEGQVLKADLCDSQGGLLLRSGAPVTQAFIKRLADLGIREVYLDEFRGKNSHTHDPALLVPYSSLVEQQLEHNYQRITAALSEFSEELAGGYATSTNELETIVADYLQATIKDTGVVLAACMGLDAQEVNSHNEELQRRSIRLAMLGTVTARQLQLPEKECLAAGIIGAIHDISLYGRHYSPHDTDYLEHPLRSIDLLRNTFGLTDQMRMIIGQVHEQCDGSGYPRRLKSVRLHAISRVLNVVDAYLTLIEPAEIGDSGFSPSDALAYLVQQALYGYFDVDIVQALVIAASIYPVGTKVLLDDGSSATVMRSTGSSYLQPVVRIEDRQQAIIDLRFSDRNVLYPDDSLSRYKRLPKSALTQVLWRPVA